MWKNKHKKLPAYAVVRSLPRGISGRQQALLLIAACLLITIAGIGLFSRYATSPAEGIIEAIRGNWASAAAFDMRPQLISGSYASFNCPRGLTAMKSQTGGQQVLAAYDWKRPDIQTWRLAVSIVDVPTLRMTDNNAYLFRLQNPQRFSESVQSIDGQSVPVMTDMSASGFSKVGFLRHGRYQAVVSLYGDDQAGSRDLQATLAMVLRSWRWRQI